MSAHWTVRRTRRPNGTLYPAPTYDTYDTNGTWAGTFTTWLEAMRWDTNPVERLENWLANQPRPNMRHNDDGMTA